MKTKVQSARILSVKIHRDVDTDPDLSHLGEYSKSAGLNAIDREERGDMGRNEFRYFNPAMSGEESGNPDSPEQDYKRMEAYNAGNWCMVGVYATAEVVIAGDVVQKIQSGGLWGIESDSDDYFKEVERDEMADLKEQLLAIGISARAIGKAFSDFERVNDA